MKKMTKQAEQILNTTGRELLCRLVDKGESYGTISKNTGISKSQVCLVHHGTRKLGEEFFRKLVIYSIDQGTF